MRKVLVAVDNTASSRRAAEFAAEFFAGDDVDVVAVNVAAVLVEPMPAAPSQFRRAMKLERAEAEELVEEQAPRASEREVRFGEVVTAISRAADDMRADLIVVGATDKGLLERLLFGSVSGDLVRRSSRPVLVVR